jgi:hypothetical protein
MMDMMHIYIHYMYVYMYGKMNSYPDLSIFINISSFAIPFLTVKPEDMMDKYRL